MEATPDEFVASLVAVFREVRRVLRDDGTLWLNLGDSYADANRNSARRGKDASGVERPLVALVCERCGESFAGNVGRRFCSAFCGGSDNSRRSERPGAVKAKDLLGIPWLVAFALRGDGWYLRSDIIWHKPNPMPESVTDRPTKAHEYVFLLSKSPRYFYDADAIREEDSGQDHSYRNVLDGQPSLEPSNGLRASHGGLRTVDGRNGAGRNKRSVWVVPTHPFAGAHFATFPPKLIEPCILAGCPPGGVVLDPFAGAGTTGVVALRHGRSFVGFELSPEYARLARHRILDDAPLFNSFSEAR